MQTLGYLNDNSWRTHFEVSKDISVEWKPGIQWLQKYVRMAGFYPNTFRIFIEWFLYLFSNYWIEENNYKLQVILRIPLESDTTYVFVFRCYSVENLRKPCTNTLAIEYFCYCLSRHSILPHRLHWIKNRDLNNIFIYSKDLHNTQQKWKWK